MSQRILIVEDDFSVLQAINRVLTDAGYTCVTAREGAEALTKMEAEPFDLVLSDVDMIGMDGITFALQATERFPDVPLILHTGGDAERTAKFAKVPTYTKNPMKLKEIVDRHIRKPS